MNEIKEAKFADIVKANTPAGPALEPTASQAVAIDQINAFFADDKAFEFCLKGSAGTGKTFLIKYAIANYKGRVLACAPTHKACGVLGASFEGTGVRVETIHKSLSLKKQYKDGEVEFVPDPKRVPMVESYDLLIIDECSMIGEELAELVRPYIDGERVKVIWMGDPLQLPPVNDGADSPSFSAPLGAELTEVVRNGGLIGEAIAAIRDDITAEVPALARPGRDDRGEIVIYGSRMWFARLLDELDDATADVQALAYTNRSVDWINAHVRKHKFGVDAPPFIEGERLVGVESFEQMGSICFYTGARMIVAGVEPGVEHFSSPSAPDEGLPCWLLTVEFPGGGKDIIPALDARQKAAYNSALSDAKKEAIADRSKWGWYFEIKERFANVRPGYATTVHKSQGSTYDRVFLAQSDVMKSAAHDPELRNRLLYVGYSRTRSGLILC